MIRTRSLVLVLGFSLALASGCSKPEAQAQSNTAAPQAQNAAAQTGKQAGLPDRDPALAHKLAAEGALILDVRTPEEFADKHIDNAVNVPVGELESRVDEVFKRSKGDKTKPIVVYCQAGGRAAKAKTMLLKAGFTQVTNLGGIDAWDTK